MTPRERILNAIRHQPVDRIPIDLGGMDSTGITAVAYNKLKNYLGIKTGKTQVYDPYQQVAIVEPEVLKIVDADVLPVFPEPKNWKSAKLPDGSYCEIPDRWNPVKLEDGSEQVVDMTGKVIAKRPKNCWYFEVVDFPLANARSIRDIESRKDIFENFDWPFFVDETIEEIGKKAQHLYQSTDYALMGNFAVHVFMGAQLLRGFEQFMMDLVLQPEIAECIFDNLVNAYIERFRKYKKYVCDYVQIVNVNDDLGTQQGLQISPIVYRKLVKPYQKKLYQFIKESGVFLFLHSDGSIYDVIPDLIEMGVDIINPVQFTAENMQLEKLKSKFGKYITFWGGGCDTQHILPYAEPNEVKRHVHKCIRILSKGSGFVFCQIHNIQPDVPPENIMAMYEAVKEFYS
ncbi:MAG TPA: uroporphyrinogen decarboxylase family protein [bacterium]|nr:uroporphyrinogen decarboxylase family protein [bacterium]HOL34571.1 uroporphyrinogen decarboxylase family protein [bacterium]HPP07614.1 uroporphyrinogen decarboxylase family protein [bacterium]